MPQDEDRRELDSAPTIPTHSPYVSPLENLAEFTPKAAVAGIFFGILFGAANAYLGLRVGLTISTSIPVAVLTAAAFKVLSSAGHRSTILEANLSQTIGSASSSVASGVIFTLPALFLWGLAPGLLQMVVLAMAGGLLGVLFMIPLRRFLIQREHGRLPYPEGTACAEVLRAGQEGGRRGHNVFWGLGIGALFKGLAGWVQLFPREIHFALPFLNKSQLGLDFSAALLGVGYILGPRISIIMVSGGLLSWVVLIPAIAFWGEGRTEPLYPETLLPIAEMLPDDIWSRYVRYIGAGAVATGGLITLFRSVPTMIESFRLGLGELRGRAPGAVSAALRTDQDLPLRGVLLALLGVGIVMSILPFVFGEATPFGLRAVAAFMVIVAAFFFVTVSSRIVGLVGVTSNPTSGMTIATLLAVSSVFLLMDWTGDAGKVTVLTVGCVVAVAASIAGDTSQDLKTGFLLGATPRRQQLGEIVGVLSSATFVCLAVLVLDRTYGFGSQELPAPQATLMKLVVEGVLENSLPWVLVGIGVAIALTAEVLRLPSLPFAVGVYLPVTTMASVCAGGLIRFFLERRAPSTSAGRQRTDRGILLGSGMVGGEGLVGVGIAAAAFAQGAAPSGLGYSWAGSAAPLIGLLVFVLLAVGLVLGSLGRFEVGESGR